MPDRTAADIMAEYRDLAERSPNPRDFDGPTQWRDFDAAHAAWSARMDALLTEARDAQIARRKEMTR